MVKSDTLSKKMTSSRTMMSISILILLTAGGLHLIQADEMFVCDYQSIYMAFVNGTSSFKDANFTLLSLHNVESPVAIQYDLRSRTIYWTDISLDAIYRSNIYGSGNEKIISDLVSPQGLAIDIENDRLYWTDAGLNLVESANLDGSNRTVIADTGHDQPLGIAVSVTHGLLFWTDWGETPKIERANIDGMHRSVIVSTNLTWPNGVTIDSSEVRLYWIEAYYDLIESVLLDGSDRIRHTYTSSIVDIHPFSMALRGSDDDIYLGDNINNHISVLDRSEGTLEIVASFRYPYGIVINQARTTGVCGADGTEPCLNGVCKDSNGVMECQCFPGYTGATCSQELNECASSPCTTGTCVNLINAFMCLCPSSHIGVNCNEDIDECASSPCLFGGTCINDIVNQWSCDCPQGYAGERCQNETLTDPLTQSSAFTTRPVTTTEPKAPINYTIYIVMAAVVLLLILVICFLLCYVKRIKRPAPSQNDTRNESTAAGEDRSDGGKLDHAYEYPSFELRPLPSTPASSQYDTRIDVEEDRSDEGRLNHTYAEQPHNYMDII